MASFEDFKLNKQLLNAIAEAGFDEPTLIQRKCIPNVAGGQDILGIAPTGTGKTAAYLIPLMKKLSHAQGDHARLLILVPTRELVTQVADQFEELSTYVDLRIVKIYGGVGMKVQAEQLAAGVDIIVSTPGRFLDLYLKGDLVVRQIKNMVMDEADKMFDMGFMPQINRILEVIPTKRQNLLFSATFHKNVEELTHNFLEFPIKIEVGQEATPVSTVEQILYSTPNFMTKLNLLLYLLKKEEFERVIVFAKTRTNAENIYRFLERKEVGELRVIHANKGQNTRLNSIADFKEGGVRVLVSTDVTARGIDVSKVSHVINFDAPLIYDDYIHRIGRTGRAMNKGVAISFGNVLDQYHYKKIEDRIRTEIPRSELPSEVEVGDYLKGELKEMNQVIDDLRKKEDPTFQGAFHKRKKNSEKKKKVDKDYNPKAKANRRRKR